MSKKKDFDIPEKELTRCLDAALADNNEEALNEIYKMMDKRNGYDYEDADDAEEPDEEDWEDDFSDDWD